MKRVERIGDLAQTRVDVGQRQARKQSEAASMIGDHACAVVVAFAVDRDEALLRNQRQPRRGDRRERRGDAGCVHVVERRLRRPVAGDAPREIVLVANELGDERRSEEVVVYVDAHSGPSAIYTTDPMKIAYVRGGTGPPVLLIHGVGGDSSNWDPIAARLRARFDVMAMDLRGHGGSDLIRGHVDVDDWRAMRDKCWTKPASSAATSRDSRSAARSHSH